MSNLLQLPTLTKKSKSKRRKTVSFEGGNSSNTELIDNFSHIKDALKAPSPKPQCTCAAGNSNEELTDNVRDMAADVMCLQKTKFMNAQRPAADKLAMLSWQRYVRTKTDIQTDLLKSLGRCKTFFGHVGMPFNYYIGDENYKRRQLREGWKERRATGIIGIGTEQDAFVLDENIVDTDDNQQLYLNDVINETRKIAHRGAMVNMINSYKKRMVTRLRGLNELETWISRLEHEQSDEPQLEALDDLIENSMESFSTARFEAKSMAKHMRRLVKKMSEKHRMLQNRMKVTSKLKERAAMATKSIKVDYTNLQTINKSFEDIINRQLILLTMSKRLSREAQENDEKLRKIQLHMTRMVKELSDDKESLFHKNHLVTNEKQRLLAKVALLEDEVEFFHNKEGLLKHQANMEAGKNIEALEAELGKMREKFERVCEEEEALRNEVQELHEQVLKYEVEHGRTAEDLANKTEALQRMEILMNEEKQRYTELAEHNTRVQEEIATLKIQNATKPDLRDAATSIENFETDAPEPVEAEVQVNVEIPPDIVYVTQTTESEICDVATDTWDLVEEMELTATKYLQTDPVEFAEDKKRGLTDPFTTDMMADNLSFLNQVSKNQKPSMRDEGTQQTPKNKPNAKLRVIDTPGYTKMIVKRLKEERENDMARLSDYIKRERVRTEATSRRLSHEHKRAMISFRKEIKGIVMAILRHRDKLVHILTKQGIVLEGLVSPTIQEFKNDKKDKTTVSLKHTAVEILNSMDFNTQVGLKEIQMKIKETIENQRNAEKELAIKNRRLEKTSKTVETFDARVQQLKRDIERARMREQYTNDRYRELLKREEELELAEEAHVTRIEKRLSELWTKSRTELEEGLDDLLQVKQTCPMAENQLRRMSRPHRPRDRFMHTLATESFAADTSSSKLVDVAESDAVESTDDEGKRGEEEEEERAESEQEENVVRLPIEINTLVHVAPGQDTDKIDSHRGTLHKGQPIASNQVSKCESEWSENKSEEVQKYMEDIQTVIPSTIIHSSAEKGEGKFLHFDSSVAKIDAMYMTIINGNTNKKKRRNCINNAGETTVLHYDNRPITEMQLALRGLDQVWNINLLKSAYEFKEIGIRVYSNALDLIRRSLALSEARFAMIAKRLVKYKDLQATEGLLMKMEMEKTESHVDAEVLGAVNKLPLLKAKHTNMYYEKVDKLVRLNTYILAEQVRVFQQIRDSDLSMNLRWPCPILEERGNRFILENLGTKPIPPKRVPKKSKMLKVVYPASMDCILQTNGVLNRNSNYNKLWHNPISSSTLQTSSSHGDNGEKEYAEPVPRMLLLDCDTLKSHKDVTLPMGPRLKRSFNPHKTVPPIKPRTLEEKKDPTSFTLPVAAVFSSADSGYDGSNVILDPAKYM